MFIRVFNDRNSLGRAAADHAAEVIRGAIASQGHARITAATAASQREFLEALTSAPGIDWQKVEAFHLDEYAGLPLSHPGGFRAMLLSQLIQKTGIPKYHLLEGDAPDLAAAARKASEAIASSPIDICFLGIGENGHIAFNDPPADFETREPYIIVNLDEACRQQQVGEAWFADISQVPTRALSMSAQQVLKARELLAVVPDLRKADAIQKCLEGPVRPEAPASIMRRHSKATLYLDWQSASKLNPDLQAQLQKDGRAEIGA
ncbi:MAG TPA: glucosamine-6-phosphate deaminase [Candidatus Eisenbacteria bacterium]|nr:glucosamine-6-phosphate deaminase [Candidatus Eisenbacteria bacterium]